MSSDSSETKNPLLALIGNAFLILVPLSLIVMLGIVGFAFVGQSYRDGKSPEEVLAVENAPAGTPPLSEAPARTTDNVLDPSLVEKSPVGTVDGGGKLEPGTPGEGSAPAAAIDPEVMALGKASYMLCAACHGPDGKGLQAGPALMAPSLVGSQILLGDPDGPLLVVLKGIAKENMNFMGVMAPLAAALDDQKLAALLTYVRNEWGNSAPPVTVEQAAAARAKFADVNAPAGVKRAEIEQIVAAHK